MLTFIVHEILGELFHVTSVVMDFYQLVVEVVRDNDIFWIAGDIDYLIFN